MHLLDKEEKDGRYPNDEMKQMMMGGRKTFIDLNGADIADWTAKQTYLNIGSTLLAAACLGVDAVPMEGIDIKALNKEFNLEEKGLTACVMVSFGYHSDDDYNAKTPKSRLPDQELFTKI